MDGVERDLHIINGNRPEEIHTIIAWDGKCKKMKGLIYTPP